MKKSASEITFSEHQRQQFRQQLLDWYTAEKRDLPWRSSGLPYHIWVSEAMLQQTQVATVIPYFHRFLAAFPTIASLADAEPQQVLKLWEGLGYYSRARNLQKAAQQMVEKFGGEIPADYEAFRQLPGVGPYIAAAVQSIAFDQPFAVVDGNVKRVLARLLGIDAPVNDPKSLKIFQQFADELLEKSRPGDYNQAMMELGALMCRPKQPLCGNCPVRENCFAVAKNLQSELPKRLVREKTPVQQWLIAIVEKNNAVLLVRRPENGLLGGLWEFPTVENVSGTIAEKATIQSIRDVCGATISGIESLEPVRHAFTHFKIICHVFRCEYVSGEISFANSRDFLWVKWSQINEYPLPKTHHKILEQLGDPQTRLSI